MLLPIVLLVLQAATASPPVSPLEALTVLDGEWSVTALHTMAGAAADRLVNHCYRTEAFYACEQVVNGKPLALIVFTATDTANEYHTKVVLPNGYSTDRADLKIAGDHWTYSGKSVSDDGKTVTWSRTENVLTGRDHIHFEQYESSDGTTWKQTNAGDEVRVGAK